MSEKKSVKPEMRITDAELSLIKMLFADNDVALKLLRKIFLPEITADAPIGQNIDLWMTLKVEGVPMEEAIINLKARNTVIQHLEMCLNQLKVLAGTKTESVEETKDRLAKDSSK
jgi:hypothetical protein